MPYDWYELVTGEELQQGDILRDCLDPVLPRIAEAPPAPQAVAAPDGVQPQPAAQPQPQPAEPEQGRIYDRVVVLTQSCDFADGGVQRVMVCPVYALNEFLNRAGGSRRDWKADLRRGRRTAYHLLNLCELRGHECEHLVADFSDAFSVPLQYAISLTGNYQRVRLLPPYREHLSQMFARFYMRVGLPIDVAPIP